MAWRRDESSSFISGSTIYAYTEVDWNVEAASCTYTHIGGVTSPYYWNTSATGTLFWREWSGGAWGAWNEYGSGTAHFGGYGDLELVRTDGFFARQAADREVQLACDVTAAGGTGSAWLTYTVPHLPGLPTGLTAQYVNDNRIDLSWTNPSTSYYAFCLEVRIDGGSWSQCWYYNGAGYPTSYSYTSATADHSYEFRARTEYYSAYSAYTAATASIKTKPAAPSAISTAAIQGSTNVAVTLTNSSNVATGIQWQFSSDGSTWGASSSVSGSPVRSFTATGISGSGYIRVRNVNATGTSGWLTSQKVTTICPPAAPTLRTPSGNVVDMADGSVLFSWLHNSLDGSAQTSYELQYAINGGAAATLSGTTDQERTLSLSGFSAGDAISWKVRTKGADPSFGPWSGSLSFNLYTAPTVSITSPGATITGMPIALTATYSDMAGFTCQAATVSLTKDGRTLYSEAATINGSSITASLTTDEFLPTNGESYTVVLTARSSSSLQTTANATFTVDFIEPQAGELSITNDPDTGYASLYATFDNHATDVDYAGDTNSQYESTEGYVRSLTVEGKSEVQSGSLVSIEGVGVSGRNLLDVSAYTWNQGASTTQTIVNSSTLKVKPSSSSATWCNYRQGWSDLLVVGQQYTLTCKYSGNIYNFPFGIGIHNPVAGAYIISPNDNKQTAENGSFAVTFTAAIPELRIWWYINYSGTNGQTPSEVTIYDVMLEQGSTAHSYEPYSLTTIPATLRSAGSVHDTLMADADSWTVGRKVGVVDLGSLTWTYGGNRIRGVGIGSLLAIPASPSDVPNIITPNKRAIAWAAGLANNHDGIAVEPGTGTLVCYAESAADAPTGLMFYELATPTTDPETSMSRIEIGSAFTVATDLDSTFELTTWDGSADAVSVSVSRVNADGLTPLITDGASGSGVVDKYAPLNTPYQYAVTTKAASQAVKTVYVDNIFESDHWFAYWGENVAKAKWNPDNGGIQVTRPQKTRVYYAGRRDPVSYDGHAVSLTETPSWMFIGKDEVEPFVKLIEDGGRGVYKSCDGWVYHADFDLTLTPSYTAVGYYGGASLGITRIAGDRL